MLTHHTAAQHTRTLDQDLGKALFSSAGCFAIPVIFRLLLLCLRNYTHLELVNFDVNRLQTQPSSPSSPVPPPQPSPAQLPLSGLPFPSCRARADAELEAEKPCSHDRLKPSSGLASPCCPSPFLVHTREGSRAQLHSGCSSS